MSAFKNFLRRSSYIRNYVIVSLKLCRIYDNRIPQNLWGTSSIGTLQLGSQINFDISSIRYLSSSAAMTQEVSGQSRPATKPRTRRPVRDIIDLTDAAVDRIKYLLSKKAEATGVILGVRRRGCNGLSYTLNYTTEVEKYRDKVTKKGIAVVVDPKDLLHVLGTRMDFVEDQLSSGFQFSNPNSRGTCGCGKSFSL